jgi:all-trans-8'-apo-beta-carotenal 15,15'-oxygenase
MSANDHERWSQIFLQSIEPVSDEVDVALPMIEGQVPKDLSGILYRNGPGRFRIGVDSYSHPFDGDGMVSRFEIENACVHYKNAYVKTAELAAEQKAGRMLYRAFGSNKPGGLTKNFLNTKFKNAANTNVVLHGGKLLALWEGGWPHELDPVTLATRSRFSYSGQLKNVFSYWDNKMNPELPFSAHPKIDPTTGRMYNFGLAFGIKNRLLLYEIESDGRMKTIRSLKIPELSFIHDFVITANSQALFFCSPLHFDLFSMITGLQTPAEAISGRRESKVRILMLDLHGPAGEISWNKVKIFEMPFSFIMHHINAFAERDRVHVFSCEMPDFPAAKTAAQALQTGVVEYPRTRLVHYILDPNGSKVERKPLPLEGFELPRVSEDLVGLPFEYFYTAGTQKPEQFPFMDQIQKVSVDGKTVAEFQFREGLVGEPIVARSLGHASYVMSLCYNAGIRKSQLLILDERDLKLLAQVTLPHSQPIGFHGNWVRRQPVSSA